MKKMSGCRFEPIETIFGWIHGIAWTKTLYRRVFPDERMDEQTYAYNETQDRYYPWYE